MRHHNSLRRRLLSMLPLGLFSPWMAAQTGGQDSILLGQSAPMTGPAAQLGIQFNAGAQMYFNQLNAKGGIAGRRVELRVLDDGYEPVNTIANTKQFIKDRVFALFGYIGTPTSQVALPLATEAKIPFFAPFTGAESLRVPFNRYALHVRASYYNETALIVNHIVKLGVKKISVFYQNDGFGKAGLEGVTKALDQLSMTPTSTVTVERNSVQVADQVVQLIKATPDVVIMISAYASCAALIKAARAAGYFGTFYTVSFVGTEALASSLGAQAAGVVVSQVMPSPYSVNNPFAIEYMHALDAVKPVRPAVNYSHVEGFIAAKIFHLAYAASSRQGDRESFINALEAHPEFLFGAMNVQFTKTKHVGSKFVELSVLTADGKVKR